MLPTCPSLLLLAPPHAASANASARTMLSFLTSITSHAPAAPNLQTSAGECRVGVVGVSYAREHRPAERRWCTVPHPVPRHLCNRFERWSSASCTRRSGL